MSDYPVRKFFLLDEDVRARALAALKNAPLGIEVVFREEEKKRSRDANSYQWAGMLGDFAREGWIDGKRYSEEVWHVWLKTKFLPDQPTDGLTLKGYRKWIEMPDGSMSMVGSTTKLTTRGFSKYLEECMAFGAQELGIRFTVSE